MKVVNCRSLMTVDSYSKEKSFVKSAFYLYTPSYIFEKVRVQLMYVKRCAAVLTCICTWRGEMRGNKAKDVRSTFGGVLVTRRGILAQATVHAPY